MNHRRLIHAALLIVGGWALSLTLSTLAKTPVVRQVFIGQQQYGLWLVAHQISPWPLGALFTGLGLMVLLRPLRWHHALLMSAAWTLTAPLNWPLAIPAALLQRLTLSPTTAAGPGDLPLPTLLIRIDDTALRWGHLDGVANWSMGLLLGALVTPVILRIATRRLSLAQGAAIGAGWIAAYLLAFGVPQAVTGYGSRQYEVFSHLPVDLLINAGRGALFGTVGGGLMLGVLWAFAPQATDPLPPSPRLPRDLLLAHLAGIRTDRRIVYRATIGAVLFLAAGTWAGIRVGITARTPVVQAISGPLLIALLTIPLIVAIWGALIAAQNAGRDSFVLLRLADIPPGEVVRGCVAATLIQLRWLLAASFGLRPFIGAVFLLRLAPFRASLPWLVPLPVSRGGAALLVIGGLAGLDLLAATLGVLLGLVFRRASALGAALAPLPVLAFAGPALATILGGVGTTRSAWVSEIGALAVFAVLPFLLSGVVRDLARRVVWPPERARLVWDRAA